MFSLTESSYQNVRDAFLVAVQFVLVFDSKVFCKCKPVIALEVLFHLEEQLAFLTFVLALVEKIFLASF